MILRWVISAVALLIVARLGLGIEVRSIWTALIGAAVLGIANIFVRPLLLLFTLPINVLTLGLFTLVVNGLIFMLVALVVPGFRVTGFFGAILGALATGLIAAVIGWILRI